MAVFQRGAVNPAGGFAQTVAHLAGLALQQIHLAWAGLNVGGSQATACGVGGVHAPFGKKLGRVLARAGAFVQQVFRRVKANAAGTNQGHCVAHRAFVAQHVQVTHHLGVVDAFNGWGARCHTRGQHHLGELAVNEVLRADSGVEFQVDTGQGYLLAKVAQGLVKLFLARHLFGNVELPTNLGRGIKQRHLKATLRGGGGKG